MVVLDIRFPTLPVAELQRHQQPVNGLAWAPHSSCHICTAGDDKQALIWDLSNMSQSMDQGLGASAIPPPPTPPSSLYTPAPLHACPPPAIATVQSCKVH